MSQRWSRAAAGVSTLVVWVVAAAALPNGLPFGVVALGLVLGSLTALTSFGLILVYRSARIINFAQAEIGGLAASVAVILVAGVGIPYALAVPIGLVCGLASGALVDVVVIRRIFRAPRLIATVATIGVAQVLGAAELGLPGLVSDLKPLTSYTSPLSVTFSLGPLVFGGDHIVAMTVVPFVVVGLGWFFTRSNLGIAIRGAAESTDRALLLGIPVRRLSLVTWTLAAGLSGVAAVLATPILGANLGVAAGPRALLAPLAAAVVARMESLPIALAAALGIGVFEQAIFWSYPRSAAVDVALFVLILVALLVQRRRTARADDTSGVNHVALSEVRPIPHVLRSLKEVRIARGVGIGAGLVGLCVAPLLFNDSTITLFSFVAIYAIVAISLVVLTGWAGQISLGHFALVGVGTVTSAALLVSAGADLFLALAAAALAGGAVAVVVGIPALRMPGMFLAVATLAFAVPVSSYLLNALYFPVLNPSTVVRPVLLGRFSMESPTTFYLVCVAFFVLTYVLARNFRRSRVGRVVLAVRDNERGAASYAVDPVRAKLTAFVFSGALAGLAGGLYVVGLRRVGYGGFDPSQSLVVFTMVVVGGLGSLPGAVLGAVYVRGVQYFLDGPLRLLATGAGLLFVVLVLPGGLGDALFRVRDTALRALARSKGLSVPSLLERGTVDGSPNGHGDSEILTSVARPRASAGASRKNRS